MTCHHAARVILYHPRPTCLTVATCELVVATFDTCRTTALVTTQALFLGAADARSQRRILAPAISVTLYLLLPQPLVDAPAFSTYGVGRSTIPALLLCDTHDFTWAVMNLCFHRLPAMTASPTRRRPACGYRAPRAHAYCRRLPAPTTTSPPPTTTTTCPTPARATASARPPHTPPSIPTAFCYGVHCALLTGYSAR